LTKLLVCDRVKASLPEGCLKHILTIMATQSDGWLKIHDLASSVIDLYFANRWRDGDKPRAGALGRNSVGHHPQAMRVISLT